MTQNYVIRGARDVTGEQRTFYLADGALGSEEPPHAQLIEADGLIALPGLIDLHTHLREPGKEDAETVASGSRAAARGGFTAVFAMANTQPVTDTAERAEHVYDLGLAAGDTQVVPIGSITRGLEGRELAELGLMNKSRAGVTFFSDDGKCVMDASLLRRAFEWIRPFKGVLAQHSQDPTLAGTAACCHEGGVSGRLGLQGWPPVAESVIIARDAQLAGATGSRLHVCHITSAEGVEVVRWAKKRGFDVTAEVTPHHLALDVSNVVGYDPVYKVNPPLRSNEHVEALREALADGTIDTVGTDHAPHVSHDKEHSFTDAAPGMLGLEQALAVVMETMVNTGRMTWEQVADRMSYAPARIGNLPSQGRPLQTGSPANLVLVDPSARAVVDKEQSLSLSRNNPYHGLDLPDPIVATFWRGVRTYPRPE